MGLVLFNWKETLRLRKYQQCKERERHLFMLSAAIEPLANGYQDHPTRFYSPSLFLLDILALTGTLSLLTDSPIVGLHPAGL